MSTYLGRLVDRAVGAAGRRRVAPRLAPVFPLAEVHTAPEPEPVPAESSPAPARERSCRPPAGDS